MTSYKSGLIKCSCGNLVDTKIYDSVNVTVSPELLDKVKKRKVNNYKCPKCGQKSELAHQFLFVDMRNNLWIWCYPEGERGNRSEIEEEIINDKTIKPMTNIFGLTPFLVFGYDELLEKLKRAK